MSEEDNQFHLRETEAFLKAERQRIWNKIEKDYSNEEGYSWIEMSRENLKTYFELGNKDAADSERKEDTQSDGKTVRSKER